MQRERSDRHVERASSESNERRKEIIKRRREKVSPRSCEKWPRWPIDDVLCTLLCTELFAVYVHCKLRCITRIFTFFLRFAYSFRVL